MFLTESVSCANYIKSGVAERCWLWKTQVLGINPVSVPLSDPKSHVYWPGYELTLHEKMPSTSHMNYCTAIDSSEYRNLPRREPMRHGKVAKRPPFRHDTVLVVPCSKSLLGLYLSLMRYFDNTLAHITQKRE